MKFVLIAVGLLAIISQVPPAFGRAGGIHAEDPWNPQHITGLPPEIRNVLGPAGAAPIRRLFSELSGACFAFRTLPLW